MPYDDSPRAKLIMARGLKKVRREVIRPAMAEADDDTKRKVCRNMRYIVRLALIEMSNGKVMSGAMVRAIARSEG